MNDTDIEQLIEDHKIDKLDLSMFSQADMLNVILQRSRVIYDVPRGGRAIQNWSKGNEDDLADIVEDKGLVLVQRAMAIMASEFEALEPEMKKFKPKKVADIGCGYAFIDYFIWKKFKCDLLLIDIEESENRNFGFRMHGAGYSNLKNAEKFLKANGVPKKDIKTVNPNKKSLSRTKDIDIAFSLLSCGFHYPMATYSEFFEKSVRKGGAVIVDIGVRDEWRAKDAIEAIGPITEKLPLDNNTFRTIIQKA